ncbi:MAG: class I SAM-dependent methyltransferase [Planctomycetota bacterium]|nr:class I SAM-dependent methyltransferase [Planctomycetota bacterium]
MQSLISQQLAQYIHDHTTPEDAIYQRLREETYGQLQDPQMQVGRVEGRFLKMMVQVIGAGRILELGTFSGYSALSMASALPADGMLITCDMDPEVTAVARRYFDESPWGDKIQIRLGPAIETLASLAGEEFDLVFLDADKENYCKYWQAVIPMLRPGGVVLADNTLWSGAVLDPKEDSDHGIVNFNKMVAEDPRVENVLLSVRDGVMFARKR